MNSRISSQWFTASGGLYLLCLLIGLLAANFIPPLSPSDTVKELAEHYRQNANGIKIFGFCLVICSPLYVTFCIAISSYIKRSGASFELITGQLALAVVGAITFLVCGFVFVAASFRPEAFDSGYQALNDLAWIVLLLPWPSFFIQNFIIGFAIIQDPRSGRLLPRWVAYVNFWVAVSFIPSTLLCFFKAGPFAWSGILVFWLAASVFVVWFLVMIYFLTKESKLA